MALNAINRIFFQGGGVIARVSTVNQNCAAEGEFFSCAEHRLNYLMLCALISARLFCLKEDRGYGQK